MIEVWRNCTRAKPIAGNCTRLWTTSQPAICRRCARFCALADPVWQSILAAPLDDEPETEQERAEVEAARQRKGPAPRMRKFYVSLVCEPVYLDRAR